MPIDQGHAHLAEHFVTHEARILGLESGDLSVGRSADVCLFDPAAHWRITPGALKSQGQNTPFMGYEMLGKVRVTLVDGHVVYEG